MSTAVVIDSNQASVNEDNPITDQDPHVHTVDTNLLAANDYWCLCTDELKMQLNELEHQIKELHGRRIRNHFASTSFMIPEVTKDHLL